jgi:hypothetical protein
MLNIDYKYKKGDEVFVEWLRHTEGFIAPKPIASSGRKYITVKIRHQSVKFTLSGYEVTDYPAHYRLWSSIEECNNARFKDTLRTAIRSNLDMNRYTWMDKFSIEELATFAEHIGVDVAKCRNPINVSEV